MLMLNYRLKEMIHSTFYTEDAFIVSEKNKNPKWKPKKPQICV